MSSPGASPSPGSSPSSWATLWRQSQELRERNHQLEKEVHSLRATVSARRLTRTSAGSVGLSPAASSLTLERADSGAAAAAQAQALLEQQLVEVRRLAAEREAALNQAAAAAEAVQREAAVAAAGIASLTAQLRDAQQEAQDLGYQLCAAQEGLAAAEAEGARRADMAAASAARLASLEAQVVGLLQAAAQDQDQPRPVESAGTSLPSSPNEYGAGPLPPLEEPPSARATRVFSVVLPTDGEEEHEGLHHEVARLQSRLVAAEAELAAQLAAKQQIQSRLNTQQAEMVALQRERELLQEQAVSLQQEVSDFQAGSRLRGGASGAEVAQEATLERSPSRTLASRMRAMLGGSPSPSSGSACPSPRSPGGGGSRPASPWARMPPLAEGAEHGFGVGSEHHQPARPPQEHLERLQARPEPGTTTASEPQSQPARPLQEHLEHLQASLAARQGELAAQEARLREQQAALATTKQVYEAEAAQMLSRTAAAEAAAQAVLQLHASKVADPRAAAQGANAASREAIEALYAQMWRERLGRQRAQAEAVDLRLKLSSRLAAATAGGNGAGAGDAELDEAVLQSLQAEMQRADHLADELARFKAHQAKLAGRAEQLELQLAQYNSLLVAAEGVAQVPRVVAPGSPRGSPSSGRHSAGSSPVKAAISALQMRRAVEEAEALRGQLQATQTEVASVRRRERESYTKRKALEGQLATLSSGLVTLRRLLERQGRSSNPGSAAASPKSTGRRGRESGSAAADAAMAVLSSLLRGLQLDEAAEGQVVVSPQASEGPGEATVAARALSALLPPGGGAAEKRSDPLEQLDVGALLPETAEASNSAEDEVQEPAPAAAGRADAAKGTPVAPSCIQEGDTIAAVWKRTACSRSMSRIPLPPPAGTPSAKPCSSPSVKPSPSAKACSSHRSACSSPRREKGLGLKVGLWCSKPSPQATLSSGAEGGS